MPWDRLSTMRPRPFPSGLIGRWTVFDWEGPDDMKYDVAIEDIDGDWFTEEIHGIPCEATSPVDMFHILAVWCLENSVMPKLISVETPTD